ESDQSEPGFRGLRRHRYQSQRPYQSEYRQILKIMRRRSESVKKCWINAQRKPGEWDSLASYYGVLYVQTRLAVYRALSIGCSGSTENSSSARRRHRRSGKGCIQARWAATNPGEGEDQRD